jgi:hypothetical protein
MRPLAPLALCLALAAAAVAEAPQGPNLAPSDPAPPGVVRRALMAEALYALGVRQDDPLAVLTAVRLARGIALRAATGWQPASDPAAADPATLAGAASTARALALAVLMAEGVPGLEDIAADLQAGQGRDRPHGRLNVRPGTLDGGQSDIWRIPFNGLLPAELGLTAEGAPLILTVTDETGAQVCRAAAPALCAFTPAWNGWFTATLSNPGPDPARYRLMTN